MRKMLLLLLLLAVPAVSMAGPYTFALRVEHVWNDDSFNWGEKRGHEWQDTDIAGSFVPSLELAENVYLTGRATRFFSAERSEFAVGLEYRFGDEVPCPPARHRTARKH